MKKSIIVCICIVFCFSTLWGQEKISLQTEVRLESRPYGPTSGTTIGPDPVIIGIGYLKIPKTRTSIFYWKAVNPFGKQGQYDAFFIVQPLPFQIGSTTLTHFLDYKFQKASISMVSIKLKGGRIWKWSVQASDVVYKSRSPRWILQPALSYGQITWSNWLYYEFGTPSWTTGLQWESSKLPVSKKIQVQAKVIINESISKKGFGQKETFSIALNFSL